MTKEKLKILVITFATLWLYSTNIVTAASDSECVPLPQSCDMLRNATANGNVSVLGRNDKILQINSTLSAIAEVTVPAECSSAIRSLMCISAIRVCSNNTNSSLHTAAMQHACMVVRNNCTVMVQKTFGSVFNCSQIQSYNDSECVEVNVADGGYCPVVDTYKISANHIAEFLGKASVESQKLQTNQTGNISVCLTEYRRITCKTFVSTCQESSNMTKESCEKKLQCLPSNSSFNKTRLCSNFPLEPPPIPTVQATTPYDVTNGFNTTLTTHLNSKFKQEYSNKSSALYKSFAEDVKNGLKIAYKELADFQEVFILELTCNKKVAVKHIVITSSANSANLHVLKARLVLANFTSVHGAYFEGKVVNANKECTEEDDHGHDDHTDSADWVYMIVFVCITALLLLAMVLCHQSK